MKQSELVSLLHEEFDVPRAQIKAIVQHTFDLITKELAEHGEVRIMQFGNFKTVERKARTGRNPKTGAAVAIPAKHVVKFITGSVLKEAVQ